MSLSHISLPSYNFSCLRHTIAVLVSRNKCKAVSSVLKFVFKCGEGGGLECR